MRDLTAIDFTQTVEQSHKANELDEAIAGIFTKLVEEYELENLKDMASYTVPWQGGRTVLERFSKLNGLAILRRDEDGLSDTIMAMILSNWQAVSSERGLAFLEFVLDMLFPQKSRIIRLWHSKELIESYPLAVSEKQIPNSFLTSRVRIALTINEASSSVSEIVPILEKLVPWNVVPEVAVSVAFSNIETGVAIAGLPYHVAYLSPY